MKYLLKVSSNIKSHKRQEFLQALETMVAIPPAEKGCMDRVIFQDLHDLNHYCCLETWSTKLALNTYMQSDKFQAFLGSMTVLGDIVEYNVITVKEIEKSIAL